MDCNIQHDNAFRRRVYEVLQEAKPGDRLSRLFDRAILLCILISISNILLTTFSNLPSWLNSTLGIVELVTTVIFTLEYAMRLYCCDYIYAGKYSGIKAKLRYMVSFFAIIDLFSILPIYITIIFGINLRAIATVKIFRILRIFKIKSFSNALMTVINVLKRKSSQLLASLSVILLLMVTSSIVMYYLENPAQPDVYSNAFSGMWWSVATFTTVGYGDIYPITVAGKVFASVIAFLGIGLVAVPTGIISSGFVEEIVTASNDNTAKPTAPTDSSATPTQDSAPNTTTAHNSPTNEWAHSTTTTLHCPHCGKHYKITIEEEQQ